MKDDIFGKVFPNIMKAFMKQDIPQWLKKRKEPAPPYVLDSVVKNGSGEYEYLLSFVRHHLGDQNQELLLHVANALVLILQKDELDLYEKNQEIKDLLKLKETIADDVFLRLLSISMLKTDTVDFVQESKEKRRNGKVEGRTYVAPACILLDLKGLASRQKSLDAQRVIRARMVSKYHPGHTEFTVPPDVDVPPTGDLLKIAALPELVQPAFHNFEHLNIIASQLYSTAFCTKDNILLCAPIGAGERDVAILTILEQLASNTSSIIVYLTPTEPSVEEVIHSISSRLRHCNVQVKDLSQHQILSCQLLVSTQILVSTPDLWDAHYKQLQDQGYTKLVNLYIIDKIHLLHDSVTGPVLESVVIRALWETKASDAPTRFVGLCAPLPNSKDIASFLNVDPTNRLFYYDNSYRPCTLTQYHCEMLCYDPLEDFWLMEDLCYTKALAAAARKHQVLIFVHSPTETTKTARNIRDTALESLGCFLNEDNPNLAKQAEFVQSKDLKDLLSCGFAIYHAELATEDRQVVEKLFSDGHVQVLVATVDFSWGTTLSADTVIIKGTQMYSHLDALQMTSCAGRPQYGSLGEVTILSGRSQTATYLALINEQLPIESQLVSKLHDRLKAEIILGTVKNTKEAGDWIRCTYLYFRMLAKPNLYGLSPEEPCRDSALTGRVSDLVHSAATMLARSNSIQYDLETGDFSLLLCDEDGS